MLMSYRSPGYSISVILRMFPLGFPHLTKNGHTLSSAHVGQTFVLQGRLKFSRFHGFWQRLHIVKLSIMLW